ncbi:MAG: histidine--tRNA ligase [Flavobacteriaceae bacterium]
MAVKPSIPKGTRDFSPTEVAQRQYIFNTIKKSFELFGFMPIETPAFENSSTLMGKYGEEGDRLIFKILESGDYFLKYKNNYKKYRKVFCEVIYDILKENQEFLIDFELGEIDIYKHDDLVEILNKIEKNASFKIRKFLEENFSKDKKIKGIFSHEKFIKLILSSVGKTTYRLENFSKMTSFQLKRKSQYLYNKYFNIIESNYITPFISEKALRYDLTVPFARYVVQHQNDITFPFKRYQMQPVWRADRPQKGRFREFYQCDADVVGSKSLWQEVAFVQLYDDVFTRLKLSPVVIKLNNRKILSGLAEIIGAKDKLIDFTVALDKLDKIGVEGVTKEMLAKGISKEAIDKVQPLFHFKGTNKNKLAELRKMLANSIEGTKGVEELQFVTDAIETIGLQSATLEIDVTLARGLNYYTGAIYEVEATGVKIGSIGGGGRYDDLTGIFGLKNVSGIGISFGLDRIYLALEESNLFEAVALPKPKVLFINFGATEALYAVNTIKELRQNNISAELYPDKAKMKKQMTYANKRQIDFVVLAGSSEIENKEFTLKNMQSGTQQNCSLKELIELLKNS